MRTHILIGLVALSLVALSLGCSSPSATPDAGASQDGQTDLKVDGSTEATLTGTTRLLFVRDGVLTVTDANTGPLIRAWSGAPYSSFGEATLSRDGQSVAFCVQVDGNHIHPFAGPIGAVKKVDSKPTHCKDARPFPDGSGVLWVEYGWYGTPASLLRFTDNDGTTLQTDSVFGAQQVWGSDFLEDENTIITLFDSQLWRLERMTGEQELLSDREYSYPFDIAPTGKIAATSGRQLWVIDPRAHTERLAFAFPNTSPQCKPGDYDNGVGCRFQMRQPAFNPTGDRVALVGVPSSLADDDDREIFAVDVQSGEAIRLTDNEHDDTHPAFGGDGMVYWIQARRTGDPKHPIATVLMRTAADGSTDNQTYVTELSSSILQVAWLDAVWNSAD